MESSYVVRFSDCFESTLVQSRAGDQIRARITRLVDLAVWKVIEVIVLMAATPPAIYYHYLALSPRQLLVRVISIIRRAIPATHTNEMDNRYLFHANIYAD